MPHAKVDVVAAQGAHKLREQVQLFDRAVRRTERADALGAVVDRNLGQPAAHILERRRPVDRLPSPALLEHRRREPIDTVERLVRKTIAVGDPALVDVLVLERHHTQHRVIFHLHDEVRAGAVVGTYALASRELPGARAVAERLAGERTDRTDIDHVARELGVDRLAGDRRDLGMFAAVDHAQLHHAGQLLAKAHAAGAVDAAAHLFHRDQRADVLVEDDTFFFVVARARGAVADREVLQLALATLVADRAIERVVDEQELHHALLGLKCLRAPGAHDHALRDRRGAGRHRLRRLFDVDQAHAAVRCDAELLVVAEVRDVGAGVVGGMHDHAALDNLHFLPVEFDFDHQAATISSAAATFGDLCSIR